MRIDRRVSQRAGWIRRRSGTALTAVTALVAVGGGIAAPAAAATPVSTRVAAAATAEAPGATAEAAGATASCRRAPLVYLVPHQDDETLSMGASIRRAVSRSGPACVHLVLVTTGQSSGARTVLARGVRSPSTGRVVRYRLTTAQFVAARDAEFRAAAARLGVPARNVHLGLPGAPRVADSGSTLTNAVARKVVNTAVDRFGTRAGYATMSDSDPQTNHRTLGAALRSVGKARKVGSVSFLYPPYQLPAPRRVVATVATGADRAALRNAGLEYGRFAPASGRYGVGWLSVPSAFGGAALNTWTVRADGRLRHAGRYPAPKRALFDSYTSYLHR